MLPNFHRRKSHFDHGKIIFLNGIFLDELVYLFRNFGILAQKYSCNPGK
jgi:hypothetical protein